MLGLVVPSLECGGGVPSVAQFLLETAIRSRRWAVTIVSLSMHSRDPESISILRPFTWSRGVRTRRLCWQSQTALHVGAFLGELEFQRYRRRRALNEALSECDIVQVVAGSAAWGNAVLGLSKPVSLHVATRAIIERRRRAAALVTFADRWRAAMTRLTDVLDDRALKNVQAIQAMNPWMLEYAERLGSCDSDIRYAPPGVDSRLFRPASTRQLQTDPYVLSVGRLDDPRKNIQLLLDAFNRLSQGVKSRLRLVLAGSSGPSDDFWRRATVLGLEKQVTYVAKPNQEALAKLYRDASAFVLASDEEGFGMVIIEAMSSGVPVIATRCGGPEGIVTDGEDGFLVNRDDAETMARRIEVLFDDHDLNRRMGIAARATVERRFDDVVAGKAFLEIWDRLAREGQADQSAIESNSPG